MTEKLQIPRGFELVIRILFFVTCFQIVFQFPYFILIKGERTNLFSTLLCTITFILVLFYGKRSDFKPKRSEIWISLIITILAILNAIYSEAPTSSILRISSLLGPGLGGYWCGRILIKKKIHFQRLSYLCTILFFCLVIWALLGAFIFSDITARLNQHVHAITGLIILLSFAPINLVSSRNRIISLINLFILVGGYIVLLFSRLNSAIFIPIILSIISIFYIKWRWRYIVLLLLFIGMILAYVSPYSPAWKLKKKKQSIFYRAESYPFAWHIIKKHPFLGTGAWAPKEKFLKDYHIRYPYVTKIKFAYVVHEIRSLENMYLTLLVEMGIPLSFLYFLSIGFKIKNLAIHRTDSESFINRISLLLPLSGTLLHLMVVDGLFYPQINWFFHLLIGIIPEVKNKVSSKDYKPSLQLG